MGCNCGSSSTIKYAVVGSDGKHKDTYDTRAEANTARDTGDRVKPVRKKANA